MSTRLRPSTAAAAALAGLVGWADDFMSWLLYGHETWLVAVLKGVPLFLFVYFLLIYVPNYVYYADHPRASVPAASARTSASWSPTASAAATSRLLVILAFGIQAARGRRGFGWSLIRVFVGLNYLLVVLLLIPLLAFNLAGGSFCPVRIPLQAVAFGRHRGRAGRGGLRLPLLRVPAHHPARGRGGRAASSVVRHRAYPAASPRSLVGHLAWSAVVAGRRRHPHRSGAVGRRARPAALLPSATATTSGRSPWRSWRWRRSLYVVGLQRRAWLDQPACDGARRRRRASRPRLVPAGRRPRPASSRPCWHSPSSRPSGSMARVTIRDRRRTCAPAWPASPTSTATGLTVHDEARAARPAHGRPRRSRPSSTPTPPARCRRWVIWSASARRSAAHRPRIHELYLRPRARRVRRHRASPCRPSTSVPPTYLTARQAFAAALERDAGTRDLRDRQVRDGLHRPAAGRVHRRHPGRRAARGLAGPRSSSRATTSSSTPPSGRRTRTPRWTGSRDLTREAIGGRLPEHRHRQQHARRPLAADRRRAAARSTRPTPPS